MKLLLLVFVVCCVSVASALQTEPFSWQGVYTDSRYGQLVFLCSAGDNGIQAVASGRVFFADYSATEANTWISGNYYASGRNPTSGTFSLYKEDSDGSLQGWYYPSKDSLGWPWKLIRVGSDVPSNLQCLYQNANVTRSIASEWVGLGAGATASICAYKKSSFEGSIAVGSDVLSYVYGNSYDGSTILAGRQYNNVKFPNQTDCSDYGNALYRVVANGDFIAGYVNHQPILPSFYEFFTAAHNGDVADSTTCSAGDQYSSCESKTAPDDAISVQTRSSASAVTPLDRKSVV